MKIIGIAGKIGAGKDTVHEILNKSLQAQGITTTKISFAKPLKDALAMWFKWDRERLEHDFDYKEGNTLDDGSIDPICNSLSMNRRQIMQVFGTDAVRNGLHKDFWVILASLSIDRGDYDEFDVGFVTDCRFPNELSFVRDHAGVLMKVERTGENTTLSKETQHASELEWEEWEKWDFTVKNDIDPSKTKKANLETFRTLLTDEVLTNVFPDKQWSKL